MYNIDLKLLTEALEYYKSKGYQSLTAPYLVDEDIVNLTLPKGRRAKKHLDLCYVGSAEQSIYQLHKNGVELSGKYMILTPCQRDEEVLDSHHLEIFLKLELISVGDKYVEILEDCFNFFQGNKEVVENDQGFLDININGLEVGSYGNRDYLGKCFSFGTGLALPRYTQALEV